MVALQAGISPGLGVRCPPRGKNSTPRQAQGARAAQTCWLPGGAGKLSPESYMELQTAGALCRARKQLRVQLRQGKCGERGWAGGCFHTQSRDFHSEDTLNCLHLECGFDFGSGR